MIRLYNKLSKKQDVLIARLDNLNEEIGHTQGSYGIYNTLGVYYSNYAEWEETDREIFFVKLEEKQWVENVLQGIRAFISIFET